MIRVQCTTHKKRGLETQLIKSRIQLDRLEWSACLHPSLVLPHRQGHPPVSHRYPIKTWRQTLLIPTDACTLRFIPAASPQFYL
uniref:Uncharacterized protein n=1 Tax=Arundo donax TaxID=35708 RepID=A0A0A9CST3_ARUDO